MDSREELLRRQAVATAEDQVPGMFFSGVLGALERKVGAQRAAEVRAQRRYPKRAVPFLRYPCADFLDVVDGVALEFTFGKALSYEDALEEVGSAMISTFMEGPVGKTMLTMLGGDPHRMMGGAQAAYAATFTFGTRIYSKRGTNEGTFHCARELFGPQITRGVLRIGLELSCPVKVTTAVTDGRDSTNFDIRVSWAPR